MSQEDRREAIVLATTPLLLQHGANVTTSQIAQAAGIAEGTVFRAFKDKQELLRWCVRAAFAADAELALLDRIAQQDRLEDRLVGAVRAVTDYQDRMWGLMSILQETGFDPHQDEGKRKGPPPEMLKIAESIAELFGPGATALRVEPQLAARLLLGLVFTNRMQGKGFGGEFATAEQLVELFLHGVLTAGGDE